MRLQVSLLAVSLSLQAVAAAQSPDPEKSADKMITPADRQAIDQGLKWLAGRQNEDGSFGGRIGQTRPSAGSRAWPSSPAEARPAAAPTAIALSGPSITSLPRPSRAASSASRRPPARGRCIATALPRFSWPSAAECHRARSCATRSGWRSS